MANHTLRITRLEYDDVRETLTLVMQGLEPERPANVVEDSWYPIPASFTVVVPVRKGDFSAASGVYIDPDSQQRYLITQTTSGGWTAPVAVDAQGRVQK